MPREGAGGSHCCIRAQGFGAPRGEASGAARMPCLPGWIRMGLERLHNARGGRRNRGRWWQFGLLLMYLYCLGGRLYRSQQ